MHDHTHMARTERLQRNYFPQDIQILNEDPARAPDRLQPGCSWQLPPPFPCIPLIFLPYFIFYAYILSFISFHVYTFFVVDSIFPNILYFYFFYQQSISLQNVDMLNIWQIKNWTFFFFYLHGQLIKRRCKLICMWSCGFWATVTSESNLTLQNVARTWSVTWNFTAELLQIWSASISPPSGELSPGCNWTHLRLNHSSGVEVCRGPLGFTWTLWMRQ